ncbi:sarcosine oxidase subunit gamma (plasmid) [Paracoccus sp. TK19116]|uniref:Sarcosine oxidase subunit gamma n=1 Tax=Paracoccus albicereus TaxID=2922394 RepID=A0ABT1MLV1_9RHOB|nr:sarcosine oxidase subunit gamma family protein [Paracoccus albicereus]MCQ0969069.1 sarcosine oxidase subunit gamma [Paracoccus albicereus]
MAETLATIRRAAPCAMISIRADLGRAGDALAEATGLAMPEQVRIVTDGSRALGWMSPDELLLIGPLDARNEMRDACDQALAGEHGLVLDVSDMRVMFAIEGPRADDVIRKLCPVDLDAMPQDGMRRTRAAQVGVAIWREGDGGGRGWRLICFRSVADYVETILRNAAIPGAHLAPR